jgi:endonuclease YncB( thermonuclease family)
MAQSNQDYTVLHGKFVIRYPDSPNQGPEPDGDTVKFLPDDAETVRDLPRISGRGPNFNSRGMVNIRLEAIDALETHFKNSHQELDGAHAARDKLLALLGFENVTFLPDGEKIESANHDQLRGFVLSNGIDGNGRMIGFVFPGSIKRLGNDGVTITADTSLIDKSVNTTLLADGYVYPAFYDTLSSTLRQHLSSLSDAARAAGKGLWSNATADPDGAARVRNGASLQQLVIWPKLFRRLADYFSQSNTGLGGFEGWMRDDDVNRDDAMLRLDTDAEVRFSDVITVQGDTIRLDVWPEQLVVVPDPA